MFTFHYKRILGQDWAAHEGIILADSVADARAKILVFLGKQGLDENHCVENTDGGITTYVLDFNDFRDQHRDRVEFYQEPSLFDLRKETSNA